MWVGLICATTDLYNTGDNEVYRSVTAVSIFWQTVFSRPHCTQKLWSPGRLDPRIIRADFSKWTYISATVPYFTHLCVLPNGRENEAFGVALTKKNCGSLCFLSLSYNGTCDMDDVTAALFTVYSTTRSWSPRDTTWSMGQNFQKMCLLQYVESRGTLRKKRRQNGYSQNREEW